MIPFHLQLSGPLHSLKLLCEKMPNGFTPHISLLRQVVVDTRGIKVIHNTCIGQGQVKPTPPSAYSVGEDIDWEGELHCDSDVSTVGFEAPGVVVKVRRKFFNTITIAHNHCYRISSQFLSPTSDLKSPPSVHSKSPFLFG